MTSNIPTQSANATMDSLDIEKDAGSDYAHLTNTAVQSFVWEDVTVTVKDRQTKKPKDILSGVNGIVKAGVCTSYFYSGLPLTM